MEGFNWEYKFNLDFPLHVFPFTVEGNRDGMHWHQYFEIGLCTKGQGKFIYMNKVYNVQVGDLFISNNFETHVAITEEGEKAEYIFLILLPDFIADPHGRGFDLKYLSFLKYNPLAFTNKIDGELAVARRLYDMIRRTLDIYQGSGPFRTLELDLEVRHILLELSRHYAERPGESGGEEPVHVAVQKAIKYLNIHYSDHITIESMATQLEMNPSYFRHLFKEQTQLSFKSYITHLRLSEARKLLLATDKSVGEIINQVGYSNMNQFYRIFDKFSHMTPGEYRKQYRNDRI